jgi:flagellar motor protein MotB
MTSKSRAVTQYVVRFGAVVIIAAGASACSTVAKMDPTGWIGGDDQAQTADNQDQTTADNGQSPDLSTIPAKPNATSTPDDQKNVSDTLAADRSSAQYSADTLRGGTESAAAPPSPDAPQATEDVTANSGGTATDQSADSSSPAPAADTGPTGPAEPGTLPGGTDAAPAQAASANPASSAQVAMTETPTPAASTSAQAAVPAFGPQSQSTSVDGLGFRSSGAPPLSASVAQFVPQPILARYKQNGSITNPAVSAYQDPSASENAAALTPPSGTRRARLSRNTTDVGGPEAMSGAVVANFDSLQKGASANMPVSASGISPTEVVFFPHDTTILSSQAREEVRVAAQEFLARGGQGYVRVVGHSSSRTANMSLERHQIWNFERSQARASAVARELIREGVPASKVLVEAVGDSQPVYYETMPQGEDGNRRAEIFLES